MMRLAILYLFDIFLEFSILIFYTKLTNKKIKCNIKNMIFLLIVSIFLMIINFFEIPFFKMTFTFIFFWSIYYYLIDNNLKMSLLYSIFLCFVILSFDLLFSIIIKSIYGTFVLNDIEKLNIKLIFSFIENILLIIVVTIPQLKKHLLFIINKILNINQQKSFLFILILLYIVSSVIFYNMMLKNISLFYFILFIFISSFLVILLQITLFRLKKQNIQNENLIQLNNLYGKLIDEDKKYKHNIINKMLTIKTIGSDDVKNLIDEYLKEGKNIINYNDLYNIPNSLKGIFGEKLYLFKQTHIIVNNNLKTDPFFKMNVHLYSKLCQVIGISLDNASESTKELKNKGYIYIGFYDEEDNVNLKICNNFNNNIFDIDKIGNKKYSTKNRGSGYGIYSVLKIKEIQTKYEIKDNEFITKISIKKSKVR